MQRKLTLWALAGLVLTGCLGEARLVERSTRAIGAAELSTLRFDVGPGRLDIVGEAEATEIEVTVDVVTHRTSDRKDEAAVDALDVALAADDAQGRLEVGFEDGPEGYFADVRVIVPSRLVLDGQDGSGDLCIHDVAGLTLRDDSGEIALRRIAGSVRVTDGSGDLLAEGIDGPLEIDDDSGQIDVTSVNGELTIFDESGDIDVEGVAGGAHVEDGSGQITLREIAGDVTILDSSGDISVETLGSVEILEDTSGEVERL